MTMKKLICEQMRDIRPNHKTFETLLAEYPKPKGNWLVSLIKEKGTTPNIIYYAASYNDIWIHVAMINCKPSPTVNKNNRTFKLRSR